MKKIVSGLFLLAVLVSTGCRTNYFDPAFDARSRYETMQFESVPRAKPRVNRVQSNRPESSPLFWQPYGVTRPAVRPNG